MPCVLSREMQQPSRRASRGIALALVGALLAGAASASDRPVSNPNAAELARIEQAFQSLLADAGGSVVALRGVRVDHAPDDDGFEIRSIVHGAGVIISADGLMLTCEHVVHNCRELVAVIQGGERLTPAIIAADVRSDLAVLRLPRGGVRPIAMGDFEAVQPGQWSVAMGNPFGLSDDGDPSLAVGVIAGLGRHLPGLGEDDDRFYYDMVHTTAAIHPGHSGGPLLNLRGELIGVVAAMHTRGAGAQAAGFAIPLNAATRRVVDELSAGRDVQHGYLGLIVRSADDAAGAGGRRGLRVERLEPDGPAARAGLRTGDEIRAIDGRDAQSPGQLAQLVGQLPVGATVRVSVVRAAQPLEILAAVGRRYPGGVSWLRDEAVLWRGLRVADAGDKEQSGVRVLDVSPDGPAWNAGVRAGQTIVALGEREVRDAVEFLLVSRSATGTVELALGDGSRKQVGER